MMNKVESNEHYIPIDKKELEQSVEKLKKFIKFFLRNNNFPEDEKEIKICSDTICQIIIKVHQRKSYFAYFHKIEISDFKELALNCFWIVKLKPVIIVGTGNKELDYTGVNEKLAVYFIIKELKILAKGNSDKIKMIDELFDSQYICELIYSFIYRDISKEALILLVETIAKSVGFKPYKE